MLKNTWIIQTQKHNTYAEPNHLRVIEASALITLINAMSVATDVL